MPFPLIASGAICLAIGYMIFWNRGLYTDDYSYAIESAYIFTGYLQDIALILPKDGSRVLDEIVVRLIARLYPGNEFLLRLVIATVVGVNACLLGSLIYRLSGSLLAAAVAGWVLLMPVYAHEAVLWLGAASYILAGCLTLLSLHAFWGALSQQDHGGRRISFGILAFTLALFFHEAFVSFGALVVSFSLLVAVRARMVSRPVLVRRTLLIAGLLVVSAGALYAALYRSPRELASRGGLDTNPGSLALRAEAFLDRLVWMTVSPEWGQPAFGDAFEIGAASLASSWGVVLPLGVAAFLMAIALARPSDRDQVQAGVGPILLCSGLAIFFGSLLFPGVLVKNQILEYRMLYAPTVGLGLAVGAVVFMASIRLRRSAWVLTFAGLGLSWLLFSTVTMTGFARIYAARSALDQKQITALKQSIPGQYLPDGSYVVPFRLDERLFGRDRAVDRMLLGVFASPWPAQDVLVATYRRDDLHMISSNSWHPARFLAANDEGQGLFLVNGQPIPVGKTVIFTYQYGSVFAIEQLIVSQHDGSERAIAFPVVLELQRAGLPTLPSLAIP